MSNQTNTQKSSGEEQPEWIRKAGDDFGRGLNLWITRLQVEAREIQLEQMKERQRQGLPATHLPKRQ